MHPITHFLATIDWSLVATTTAKLLAILFVLWGVVKVGIVGYHYGWLTALTFAGLHLPLSLFSAAIAVFFFASNGRIGAVAVVSAVINALLI